MRAPLLLTGGPAAGKSTTARRLADGLPLAAVVDVDDVRQLVTSGHVAPWQGDQGTRLRARSRPAFITEQELDLLHRLELHSPAAADHALDVGSMGVEEQVRAVDEVSIGERSRR